MCFHYTLTIERTEVSLQLHADWDDIFDPMFHADGFAHPPMPVITMEDPGKIQLFQWGLVPFWVKSKEDADKLSNQTLNARSETIFEKPSFRNSIINQRCLVPATGFFEWMDFQKKKYPHLIYIGDHELFCFAGIYSQWTDKETGEHIQSFSIITTDANPMMERIHNLKKRMPVIIPKDRYQDWLKKGLTKEEIKYFLNPFPDTEMQSHTISKLITSRSQSSNVPEVVEKYEYPELQLLS